MRGGFEWLTVVSVSSANVVKETAEAEAKKVKSIATVEGDVIKQEALVTGLRGMCFKFNVTEEDQKLSLFFFNSLKGMEKLRAFVYDTS